jgi:hypothetical protein
VNVDILFATNTKFKIIETFQLSMPYNNTMCDNGRAASRELQMSSSQEVSYSVVQYNTVQYSTVQYSVVQLSTVHHSIVQYSVVQYGTVRYSTV